MCLFFGSARRSSSQLLRPSPALPTLIHERVLWFVCRPRLRRSVTAPLGLLAVEGGCLTVGHFESLAEVCAEVPRRFELESGTV